MPIKTADGLRALNQRCHFLHRRFSHDLHGALGFPPRRAAIATPGNDRLIEYDR